MGQCYDVCVAPHSTAWRYCRVVYLTWVPSLWVCLGPSSIGYLVGKDYYGHAHVGLSLLVPYFFFFFFWQENKNAFLLFVCRMTQMGRNFVRLQYRDFNIYTTLQMIIIRKLTNKKQGKYVVCLLVKKRFWSTKIVAYLIHLCLDWFFFCLFAECGQKYTCT